MILPLYRKPIRLKNYDYSQDGYYFVTICTKNREIVFGNIKNAKMILNKYGEIVKRQWLWLAEQYHYVILDEYVIMPNQMHGILIIDNCRGRSRPALTIIPHSINANDSQSTDAYLPSFHDCDDNTKLQSTINLEIPKIKSLSELIGAFKTTSLKIIHQSGLKNFVWQRSFYDHIIRDDNALVFILQYIKNNPTKWELEKDRNHSKDITLKQ